MSKPVNIGDEIKDQTLQRKMIPMSCGIAASLVMFAVSQGFGWPLLTRIAIIVACLSILHGILQIICHNMLKESGRPRP